MPIPNQYKHRHIYQFTHLNNLAGILEHGLLSYNEKERLGLPHLSIAAESIQARRAAMAVPAGPGGVVHDYVPFYFSSRSPMLLSVINSKNVDQLYLLYLGVPIEVIESDDVLFTNASANTIEPPAFFVDPSDLTQLDWANIDSKKWGSPSEAARHARMAEALVHESLDVSDIDHIIVWNEGVREKVERIYEKAGIEPPSIKYDGHLNRHFYYLNFYEEGRASILTGPMCLRAEYENAVDESVSAREQEEPNEPVFDDLEDAVEILDGNFFAILELEAIDELETANAAHREGVGAHTRTVVAKLRESDAYASLSERQKKLAVLAAYFHDIGKGESPKDDGGKQRVDPNHPARAIQMVQRILSEEFGELEEEDIRQILLLVAYHDILGDVVGKGRDREQLLEVITSEEDFDMLAALSCADVESLIPSGDFARMMSPHFSWLAKIKTALPELREWVLENLGDDE